MASKAQGVINILDKQVIGLVYCISYLMSRNWNLFYIIFTYQIDRFICDMYISILYGFYIVFNSINRYLLYYSIICILYFLFYIFYIAVNCSYFISILLYSILYLIKNYGFTSIFLYYSILSKIVYCGVVFVYLEYNCIKKQIDITWQNVGKQNAFGPSQLARANCNYQLQVVTSRESN